MIYELDRKFIKKQRLGTIALSLFFVTAGAIFSFAMAFTGDWVLLGGLYFIYIGFTHYKTIKYWKSNKPKFFIYIRC